MDFKFESTAERHGWICSRCERRRASYFYWRHVCIPNRVESRIRFSHFFATRDLTHVHSASCGDVETVIRRNLRKKLAANFRRVCNKLAPAKPINLTHLALTSHLRPQTLIQTLPTARQNLWSRINFGSRLPLKQVDLGRHHSLLGPPNFTYLSTVFLQQANRKMTVTSKQFWLMKSCLHRSFS